MTASSASGRAAQGRSAPGGTWTWLVLLAMAASTACDGCDPNFGDGGPQPTDAGSDTLVDSGPEDAGIADAGVTDAGAADAGFDAGVHDAGVLDAGHDAGVTDAGAADAGFDAGPGDGGSCASTTDCADDLLCSDLRDVGLVVEPWCRAPAATGDALLTACDTSVSCRSQLCVPRARVCSEACEQSARDCGSGVCTSYPFAYDIGDTPTWIGVCAATCLDDGDCASGRVCTYNGNPLTDTFDRVCEVPDGAKPFGDSCGADAECASGLCLDSSSMCSTPCDGPEDCGAPLATCEDATVGRPSGNGTTTIKLCR